jgi:hypothetical protein
MNDFGKTELILKRLLETTQDIFIFESLRSGISGEAVKGVLRVDTDRVTRVSKLLPKKLRKQGSSE